MIHIGIDPGKSGGIAFTSMNYAPGAVGLSGMSEHDLARFLKNFTGGPQEHCAIIEKVHAMPSQGVSSTFTFGMSYGGLRQALASAGIPFETVTPGKWQKEFGLVFPKKLGLSTTEKKNRHKARAQELFPRLKITHAIADALLIMEYGRRTHAARASA